MIVNDKMKSWSIQWEKVFKSQEWGKYPPEELIRFIARNFYKVPKRKEVRFLEIGCGTGANCWYLAREGFTVYGVDGSKTAISKAEKRFKKENLKCHLSVMDYVSLDFPDNYFDAIIDVCSIQHNHTRNVPTILSEVRRTLKPKGKLFSMIVAKRTYFEPYKNKGYVHFYSLNEIKKIFRIFRISSIEKSERTENNMRDKIIHWVISCEKL